MTYKEKCKKAKEIYGDVATVRCVGDGEIFEFAIETLHSYKDDIWSYSVNGRSVKLHDASQNRWAEIVINEVIIDIW